jgi:hypothetical protein
LVRLPAAEPIAAGARGKARKSRKHEEQRSGFRSASAMPRTL